MGLSSNGLQSWNHDSHQLHPSQQSATKVGGGGRGFSAGAALEEPAAKPKPSSKRQLQQQPAAGDKCPRCGSGNTKFCYYNNYNKTQPRHFCKACKRHWTKGGTLRNVPVGGGRKHKRIKTCSSSSSTTTAKPLLGLGFTADKNTARFSSSSISLKPVGGGHGFDLSPQDHIIDSSNSYITAAANNFLTSHLSTDHMPQINQLLDFGGSSSTFPYQSLMSSTTPTPTTTTTNSSSQLEESLSIFNSSSSSYALNSFPTSSSSLLYGYTSDQSTSLELDGTAVSYDQPWKSVEAAVPTTSNLHHHHHQAWDDKFVSPDEIAVSWDIDSEINFFAGQ